MFKKISNTQSKHIKNLHRKKNRQNFNEFIVEGTKTVLEFLNSEFENVGIFADEQWLTDYINKIDGFELYSVNSKQLQQISTFKNPQPVLATFKIPKSTKKIDENFILFLEDIRDPGNLGTIIRSAEWFGLKQVFCSETCADVYNTKVIQASMGSAARVLVNYIATEDLLKNFPNHKAVLADMNGIELKKYAWAEKNMLIIGNEANGVSDSLRNTIGNKITIPRKGNAESLNASISAAIILSHI